MASIGAHYKLLIQIRLLKHMVFGLDRFTQQLCTILL